MRSDQEDWRMEMGAFTGALVALLAKDMASAIASEIGKDVSGAAKQALRRLGQRLRREPATRAAMEQLETNPSNLAVQERLAEQLTGKLKDPAFREDLQVLLAELDRQAAAAVAAEERVPQNGSQATTRPVGRCSRPASWTSTHCDGAGRVGQAVPGAGLEHGLEVRRLRPHQTSPPPSSPPWRGIARGRHPTVVGCQGVAEGASSQPYSAQSLG
jgi:hypothetical protein